MENNRKIEFAKMIANSSDGTYLLELQGSNRLLAFDANKSTVLEGAVRQLSSWLSNCLRVFTPVEYRQYEHFIWVSFPLEGITFFANRIEYNGLDKHLRTFIDKEGLTIVDKFEKIEEHEPGDNNCQCDCCTEGKGWYVR